jgi:hypothetical protein
MASLFPQTVGVLDVAGGGGDLAFELGVRRGIPSVVVDPRAPRHPQGEVGLALTLCG